MKKLMMSAAVLGLAASAATAQVYSQNIVGYAKSDKPAGLFTIIGSSWEDSTVADVIGTGHTSSPFAASADKVSVYVPGAGYTTYFLYEDFTGANQEWRNVASPYVAQGDISLPNGSAVFMESVANPTTTSVVACGEVPVDQFSTNSIVMGLQLVAYPFTAEVAIDDLALTDQGTASFFSASADKISFYTPGVGYTTYYLAADFTGNVLGWYDIATGAAPASPVSLPVGTGFFYESLSSFDWIEVNPYFDSL